MATQQPRDLFSEEGAEVDEGKKFAEFFGAVVKLLADAQERLPAHGQQLESLWHAGATKGSTVEPLRTFIENYMETFWELEERRLDIVEKYGAFLSPPERDEPEATAGFGPPQSAPTNCSQPSFREQPDYEQWHDSRYYHPRQERHDHRYRAPHYPQHLHPHYPQHPPHHPYNDDPYHHRPHPSDSRVMPREVFPRSSPLPPPPPPPPLSTAPMMTMMPPRTDTQQREQQKSPSSMAVVAPIGHGANHGTPPQVQALSSPHDKEQPVAASATPTAAKAAEPANRHDAQQQALLDDAGQQTQPPPRRQQKSSKQPPPLPKQPPTLPMQQPPQPTEPPPLPPPPRIEARQQPGMAPPQRPKGGVASTQMHWAPIIDSSNSLRAPPAKTEAIDSGKPERPTDGGGGSDPSRTAPNPPPLQPPTSQQPEEPSSSSAAAVSSAPAPPRLSPPLVPPPLVPPPRDAPAPPVAPSSIRVVPPSPNAANSASSSSSSTASLHPAADFTPVFHA